MGSSKHAWVPLPGWRRANARERSEYGVEFVKKNKRKRDSEHAAQPQPQQDPQQEEPLELELHAELDAAPFVDTESDEEPNEEPRDQPNQPQPNQPSPHPHARRGLTVCPRVGRGHLSGLQQTLWHRGWVSRPQKGVQGPPPHVLVVQQDLPIIVCSARPPQRWSVPPTSSQGPLFTRATHRTGVETPRFSHGRCSSRVLHRG